jgi:AcrR family transcriptional regulator
MQALQTRSPGRPRCPETRDAVLRAAYALLGEGGLANFTIEGVAARSGVARTTIYRWWPSKGALAMDGLLSVIAQEMSVPRTASPLADIKAQVGLFARLLHGANGHIIRRIVAEGQDDPATLKAFLEGFVTPRRAEGRAVLNRAIEAGELPPETDPDIVLAGLYGAIYTKLMLHEAFDEDWVSRLCDHVLRSR